MKTSRKSITAILAISMLIFACKPDKSKKFVGSWICKTHGQLHETVVIKKDGDNFLITIPQSSPWKSIPAMEVIATYNKEKDQIDMVEINSEILYNSVNKELWIQEHEMVENKDDE